MSNDNHDVFLEWGRKQFWWDDAECLEVFEAAYQRQVALNAARLAWQPGAGPPPQGPPADRHHDGSERHADGSAGYGCYVCHDAGFVRREVPLGQPDFGREVRCQCQGGAAADAAQALRRRRAQALLPPSLDAVTLASFLQRKGTAEAKAAAQNWRHDWEQGRAGWLTLYGPPGCGKTHLLGALANSVLLTTSLLWCDTPWVLEQMAADNFAGADQWLRSLLTAPVLVLDEFSSQNPQDWARQKLEIVVVERYAAASPTLFGVTGNPDALVAWSPRIASRLSDRALVREAFITAGDYRQRKKGAA